MSTLWYYAVNGLMGAGIMVLVGVVFYALTVVISLPLGVAMRRRGKHRA